MDEEQTMHTRRVLACSHCDSFLRKFNQGEFTIGQICQFFKHKYKMVYVHITELKSAKLITNVEMGKSKRLLFTITDLGKLALMKKGSIE